MVDQSTGTLLSVCVLHGLFSPRVLMGQQAGAMAMGAHRSSLREDSQVSSAALAFDVINGNGIKPLDCRQP